MLHLGGGGVISHLSCRDDQSRIPSWRAAGMAGSTAGTAPTAMTGMTYTSVFI